MLFWKKAEGSEISRGLVTASWVLLLGVLAVASLSAAPHSQSRQDGLHALSPKRGAVYGPGAIGHAPTGAAAGVSRHHP